MKQYVGMDELQIGEEGVVHRIELCGTFQRRIQDLGLIHGTTVQCIHQSPCGDPIAYLIRGAIIAMRNSDAKHIIVQVGGELCGPDRREYESKSN